MRVLLALLIALGLLTTARAEAPPAARPLLRIEAGMHTAVISRIAVNRDGTLFATASHDKTVRLWETATGKLLRIFRVPLSGSNSSGGKIYSVALSPDGKHLVFGGYDAHFDDNGEGHFLYVFDLATGQLETRIGPIGNVIHELRFSADGHWLAAGLGGTSGLRLWRVSDSIEPEPMADTKYQGAIYGLSFSPDGTLVTTCEDRMLRLYRLKPSGASFASLIVKTREDSAEPAGIAFSPDGKTLAIGHFDSPTVTLRDGHTLAPDPGGNPDASFATSGDFTRVAWSADGKMLFSGGRYYDGEKWPVIAWPSGGHGAPLQLSGLGNGINDLEPLPQGGLVMGGGGPYLATLDANLAPGISLTPVTVDARNKLRENFQVSDDGSRVWFGLGFASENPTLWDMASLQLNSAAELPAGLHPPLIEGIDVRDWEDHAGPQFGDKTLTLDTYEVSRSLAVFPDKQSFVIGSGWSIHRFDAAGNQQWAVSTASTVWGVNLSSDGQRLVTMQADGTLRWYRAADGVELLALFISVPDQRWVAWTPDGYYAASPGGEDLIGWQVNGPDWDAPVSFFPASRFRDTFYRPDVVTRVLAAGDAAKALEEANAETHRQDSGTIDNSALPPVVEIVDDPRGLEAADPTVELHYRVRTPSGRPVDRIEVRIDGQLVDASSARAATEADGTGDGANIMVIPVPAQNGEISLVAYHGSQASAPATIPLLWRGATPKKVERHLRALLVGVSQYENPSLKLNYAAKDAQDLAAVLQNMQGHYFKTVETKLLLNADATEDNIETALSDLASASSPDDYTLVFMAGHGATRQNRFLFLPETADLAENRLAATSLRGSVIAENLSAMQGKVLFFIDACYSARGLGLDMSGFINSVTGEENAVMMYASSAGNEVSFESPTWKNGAFTRALIDILTNPASYDETGALMSDELAVSLRKQVRKLTSGRQTPVGQASRAVPPFPVAGL
jgi:WD40 repeat protein